MQDGMEPGFWDGILRFSEFNPIGEPLKVPWYRCGSCGRSFTRMMDADDHMNYDCEVADWEWEHFGYVYGIEWTNYPEEEE